MLVGSLIAKSRMYFATGPEVIQLFLPLMMKLPSPCLIARQRIAVASEPDCGSVRANAPIAEPFAIGVTYLCFCSSVPNFSKPLQYSVLFTDMIVECAQSAAAISIIASA